jgi:hypothetical protein
MTLGRTLPALALLLLSSSVLAQAEAVSPPAAADPTPAEPAPAAEEALDAEANVPVTLQAPPGEPVAPAAPADPKHLRVSEAGWFEPSLLLQGWFWVKHKADTTSTFRLRRAELKVKGELVPGTFAYSVMIDPAKQLPFDKAGEVTDADGKTLTVHLPPKDTSVLQDVFVTYITEYVDVSFGQFKVPLSYEGYNSSSKLIMPERTQISRYYGDKRDIGLRFEKEIGPVRYVAGVFNGNGLNRLDNNNQKDAALRLEYKPVTGLLLAAVGYTSVGERDEPGTKDRVEGDVRVELGDFTLQAEYLRGWDGPAPGRVEGHGAYGALAYKLFGSLEPIVRVGFLDKNLDAPDDRLVHFEGGLNYYVQKHELKLQASYSAFDHEDPDAKLEHEAIAAVQLGF